MTKHPLSILGACAALLLAGCTTDDPKKGGLFGGLIGLGSGAYEDRVVDQTEALKTEEIRYQDGVGDSRKLDQSVRESRARASKLEGRLLSLERDLDGLDGEIAALQQDKALTQDEVAKAEADVASLLDDIDRIEAEQTAQEEAKALGADATPDADPAEFGEPPREHVSDLRAYIIELQEAVDALKLARDRRAGKAEGAEPD